ncbi:MAG: MBL fold metallo-hydrolase [Phycisphaerae bacterium]|nr:MBL fold metallo-hydrolase [Phycisphaerae bacterium]
MAIEIKWIGHASFKISACDKVVYIDPWKVTDSCHDADYILVSHSHHDHYSADDIEKISKDGTSLIGSADVIAKQGNGHAIKPGKALDLNGITVTAVAAYNPDKDFHPMTNEWVGFVIEIDGKKIYYAGDTGVTSEMKTLIDIDMALVPVGGTYTMNPQEAATAVNTIKPKAALPYHWGDIVGDIADAELFDELANCTVEILNPGQSVMI